jgi:hypothetical protein
MANGHASAGRGNSIGQPRAGVANGPASAGRGNSIGQRSLDTYNRPRIFRFPRPADAGPFAITACGRNSEVLFATVGMYPLTAGPVRLSSRPPRPRPDPGLRVQRPDGRIGKVIASAGRRRSGPARTERARCAPAGWSSGRANHLACSCLDEARCTSEVIPRVRQSGVVGSS